MALTARIRSSLGFTLLELLVVLALMASIVALVPAAYDRLSGSISYKSALADVRSGLTTARQLAISEGREVSFSVDLSRKGFSLEGEKMAPFPRDVEIRATVAKSQLSDDGVASIRFLPSGSATGGSIDVVRTSGAGSRLVVDWLTGRVSLEPVRP